MAEPGTGSEDRRRTGLGNNVRKARAPKLRVKQASKAGISPAVFAQGAGVQAPKIGAVPKPHFKAGV